MFQQKEKKRNKIYEDYIIGQLHCIVVLEYLELEVLFLVLWESLLCVFSAVMKAEGN